jgi:hypothetical protein
MSLINEALKRAEMEKRQNQGGEGEVPLAVWPAPGEEVPFVFGKNQTGLRGAVILGACILVTVGVVLYFSLPPAQKSPPPAQASVRVARAGATSRPAAAPASQPARKAPSLVETALKQTLAALRDYRRPPGPPPTTSPAGQPSSPQASYWRGAAQRVSPPATAPVVISYRPPPQPPAKTGQADTPFEASHFQLGGILESSGGASAIVNNQLVSLGDEVNGAKVVVIRKYTVVLEKDGKRLLLRL